MKYSYTFKQIRPDRLFVQVEYSANNHETTLKNFYCDDFSNTNIHYLASNFGGHIVTNWEKIDGLESDSDAVTSNNSIGVSTTAEYTVPPNAILDTIPLHNEYTHYAQQRAAEKREDGNWYVGYDIIAHDANTVVQNIKDDAHVIRKTKQYNSINWVDSSNNHYIVELGTTDRLSLNAEVVSINNNLRSNSAKWRMLNRVTSYHANGAIDTTTFNYVHRTTTNQEMLLIANTVASYTQKLFDTEELMSARADAGNTNPLLWDLCYSEV